MPLRCLLLPLSALLIGCAAPRDSAEAEGDAEATAETETTRDGGAPDAAVYPYGAWDFTATQIGGDETFTGTLTLAEEEGASRVLTSTGIDAPLLIDAFDLTNTSFMLEGLVQTANGPLAVRMAGSMAGGEMSAEAELEGSGTYAVSAVRQ
jgi:hypothetical protein